jgi:ABC-type glycerol-3-phosphate transport system substrate-binding protein
MMKLRKSTITAMLVLALLAACGNDDPTGDVETGTGGNVETTGGGAYN